MAAQLDEWEEYRTHDSKSIANTQRTSQLLEEKAVLSHSAPCSKTSPVV